MKAIADCTGSRFSSQSKEPDHVISRRLLGDCTIPAVQYSRYEKGGRGGLMMNVNEFVTSEYKRFLIVCTHVQYPA